MTVEQRAELRELLDTATERPWVAEYSSEQGNCVIPHDAESTREAVAVTRLHHQVADANLIVAAVNALPALLDAADERDELAGVESRLSALLWDLTGGKLSKTSYPVAFMVQEIEEHLAQYHESDAAAERDRLAATIERVREQHRAVGIYDSCECTDEEKETGHKDVEEVGLTCNKLYDICAECCRDDVYQTETCAAYHDHKPGEAHHCKTMEALARDDGLVYHKDVIEASAPLIAAQALQEAADDIERRNNEPGLILMADRYGGYYAGERHRAQCEVDILRARADEVAGAKSTKERP